jgi:pimeloyl-ACP methyl ester carboxylesterase
VIDDEIEMSDGRTVGYTDNGTPDQVAVLWCHGGPGSRLEPVSLAPAAVDAGYRIIGIDRPGYGKSTERAGRTIADWVPDGLAVANHLGINRFATVGVSTGGAYALALAALAPDRVSGVIACCALTDMRWQEGKAMMLNNQMPDIWSARDRDAARAIAAEQFGEDGSKLTEGVGGIELPAADLALFSDPVWLSGFATGMQAMFAQGVIGYADDRLADGPGWGTFDASSITCPVIVIHGGSDTIVPVAHAHHTASIVPGAQLRVFDDLGHFSITTEVVGQLAELPR